MTQKYTPGPFGCAIDELAREAGGWSDEHMVHTIDVIGTGENPQVLLTGSQARWMPKAERWDFTGFASVKAVVRLSDYRAAIARGNPA